MVSHNLKLVFSCETMYEHAKVFYTYDSYYLYKDFNDESLTILFEDEDNEPELLKIQLECELCSLMISDYCFIIC